MTKKKRRTYTKEFKLEAVQLVEARGGNASEVARHLGVSPDLVNRWRREYSADKEHTFPGLGKLKQPDEEMRKLKKKLDDVKMERDILKKALGIFSKPSH